MIQDTTQQDVGMVIESILRQEFTTPTTRNSQREQSGLVRLALRERKTVRLEKALDRRLELIDANLLETFKQLAAGEIPWPLFIHGPPGTGKTLAALCFCDITAGAAFYTTVDKLSDRIIRRDDSRLFEDLALDGMKLAVLDELGERCHTGDLQYKATKRFADARELAKRVAIYVSNLDAPELSGIFDDRIMSRICRGTIIELGGADRRLTQDERKPTP